MDKEVKNLLKYNSNKSYDLLFENKSYKVYYYINDNH